MTMHTTTIATITEHDLDTDPILAAYATVRSGTGDVILRGHILDRLASIPIADRDGRPILTIHDQSADTWMLYGILVEPYDATDYIWRLGSAPDATLHRAKALLAQRVREWGPASHAELRTLMLQAYRCLDGLGCDAEALIAHHTAVRAAVSVATSPVDLRQRLEALR